MPANPLHRSRIETFDEWIKKLENQSKMKAKVNRNLNRNRKGIETHLDYLRDSFDIEQIITVADETGEH